MAKATKASVLRELLTKHPMKTDLEILTQAMIEHPELAMTPEVHAHFPRYYRKELAAAAGIAKPPKAPKAPKAKHIKRIKRSDIEWRIGNKAVQTSGITLGGNRCYFDIVRGDKAPLTPTVTKVKVVVDVSRTSTDPDTKLLDLWPDHYSGWSVKKLWKGRRALPLSLLRPALLELRYQRDRVAADLRKAILKDGLKNIIARRNLKPACSELRRALRKDIISAGSYEAAVAQLNLANTTA